MSSVPARADAEPVIWASCDVCGLADASAIANSLAPSPIGNGSVGAKVYVVGIDGRQLWKFGVQTDREPGLYSRNVWEEQVEADIAAGQEVLWDVLPLKKTIHIPGDVAPSAADHIRNPQVAGQIFQYLDTGASGLVAMLRAARFTANVTKNQVSAAMGMDRGPITLRLVFADGSRIKVVAVMATDGMDGGPSILSLEIVPGSALSGDGVVLPTSPEGFAGFEVNDLSPATETLMRELIRRFGLELFERCGGPQTTRFSCDASGRCTVTASC